MFYNPFNVELAIPELGKVPVIVYPSKGAEEAFDRNDVGCVERFLNEMCSLNWRFLNPDPKYGIGILWNEGKDKMTDLWLYSHLEDWGSGPLVNVRVFRNFGQYIPSPTKREGHSAGNGLIMLGREEEHRQATGDLKTYFEIRPELPASIKLGEDFYV